MADLMRIGGGVLTVLVSFWIVAILIKMVAGWLIPARKTPGLVWLWLGEIIEMPVNWVRVTVPTLYRNVDVAPWLTIVVMVLMKTFVFRAMIYWGMLHQ
jgi:hypothetical protein